MSAGGVRTGTQSPDAAEVRLHFRHIPANQLALNKLLINQAFENMGLRTTSLCEGVIGRSTCGFRSISYIDHTYRIIERSLIDNRLSEVDLDYWTVR